MTSPYLTMKPRSMFDVIKAGVERPRDHVGMSDDAMDAEYRAQKRLDEALDEFYAACANVNDSSSVVSIDMSAVDAFIHDELPNEKRWDERISEARRG